MEWEGIQVRHLRYGSGTVRCVENGYVKVVFPELGEKSFLYPDAFQKFLRTENAAAAVSVAQEIIMKKAEESAIDREKEELRRTLQASAEPEKKPGRPRAKKK